MRQVSVFLGSPERVQSFVKAITPLSGDFEVISGKYLLDARSLMGLFSLDLLQPITLKIYDDRDENLAAITPFLAGAEDTTHE